MKRFLIRLFLFLSPFIGLLLIYFINDPFKVLYHYNSFYEEGRPSYITLNRDYVSMEMFEKNYAKEDFDSYIFGNSRSLVYDADSWKKYISSGKVFHFDAFLESLYGIERKLAYLAKRKVPVRNALLVIDHEVLSKTENQQGHIFRKHPRLSGESKLLFQLGFIKAFFDSEFLTAYMQFLVSGKVKDYSFGDHLFDGRLIHYNIQTNDFMWDNEDEITKDSSLYYRLRGHWFSREPVVNADTPIIGEKQVLLLKSIAGYFALNSTHYKIIISPLYDQIKLNNHDLTMLRYIFGTQNVFDFSGINSITQNRVNYFDRWHYRKRVAEEILKTAYANPR